MKILKNTRKSLFGIDGNVFVVIGNSKEGGYEYYLTELGKSVFPSLRIYKSKEKSKFLNKYLLFIIGYVYNIIVKLLLIPITYFIYPIICYFNGGKNFITNSFWVTDVRLFGWMNIVIIIILIVILILES